MTPTATIDPTLAGWLDANDRRLHDDLGRTAALARQRFEQALRRIAAEEGWQLDADRVLE